jgi:hypothetical protein
LLVTFIAELSHEKEDAAGYRTLRWIICEYAERCCPGTGTETDCGILVLVKNSASGSGFYFAVELVSEHGHGACREYLLPFFTNSSGLQTEAP